MKKLLSSLLLILLLPVQISFAQRVGVPDPSFGLQGMYQAAGSTAQKVLMFDQPGSLLMLVIRQSKDSSHIELIYLDHEGKRKAAYTSRVAGTVTDACMTPEGKHILLGGQQMGSEDKDWSIWMISPEGKPVGSFGKSGVLTYAHIGDDETSRIRTDARGHIWLAGQTSTDGWAARDMALLCVSAKGEVDTVFGEKGLAIINTGLYDVARDLATDPAGRILLAGQSRLGQMNDFVALRLDPSGRPDEQFGNHGMVRLRAGIENDYLERILIQPDGKIILAGHCRVKAGEQGQDWAIFRLTATGNPDLTFANGGLRTLNLGGADYLNALALQPDGNLLLGGVSNFRPALVRLNVYGYPDPAFGKKGVIVPEVGGRCGDQSFQVLALHDRMLMSGIWCGQASVICLKGNPQPPGLTEVMGMKSLPDSYYGNLRVSSDTQIEGVLYPGKGARLRTGKYSLSVIRDGAGEVIYYVNGRYSGVGNEIPYLR